MGQGKTVKNISRDKGGLHMKMVLDTKETIAYAKQLGPAFHVVATNKLLEIMEEVKEDTKSYLYSKRQGQPTRWEIAKGQMKRDMFRSDETALSKIANSIVVKETRDREGGILGIHSGGSGKTDSSVSMWSQDEERPENYTSAGVRGSRARSGRKFEGKIAQYYEQGRAPFTISPGNKGSGGQFKHPGYPKLGYMARARRLTITRVREDFPDELERKMKPNAVYGSKRIAQVGAKEQARVMTKKGNLRTARGMKRYGGA